MNRRELYEHLRSYGLKIFPLRDKTPARANWQNIDEDVPENTPFGVQLGGNSKVFVIDVDDYSLLPHFNDIINKTYSTKTGRGFHIYGKAKQSIGTNKQLKNNKNQGIDIKTTGGYVVGESSDHFDKTADGNYVKSGKKYELLSQDRTINHIDFETELKPILEKLGFELKKEPQADRVANTLVNGAEEGSRNNTLFETACFLLNKLNNPTVCFDFILTANNNSPNPLPRDEVDQLFQSATATVQEGIEESNSKIEINNNVDYTILDEEPQKLRALTLDEDNTRHVLVYLPTKVEEKERNRQGEVINVRTSWVSKAYIVSNGVNGKKITALESEDFKEKYVNNLYPESPEFSNRWQSKDIKQYIATDEKVNPKELFDDLLSLERRYFENQYDFDYYYEALWKTHTYCYTLFDHTPYDDYSGMKNVGKTKRLSFSELVCYNGILTGDASLSSIFRTIEGTGATLLLDETERLGGSKDDNADFENLLRNGFSKNGHVTRAKETKNKDYIPMSFSVYSPKGFGHINELDNVLEDRVIKVKIVRSNNKAIKDRDPDERDPLIYSIRERLYRLWLDYGYEIYKLIPEAMRLVEELSGRELKIWLPILTLALFFEKQGVEGLIDKIKAKALDTSEDKIISDLEDNDDIKILTILDDFDTIPFRSQELYNLINTELSKRYDHEKLSDRKMKKALERLGFRQGERDGKSTKWINITPEKIQEIKERTGLVKPTQATLSETDSRHENPDNVGNVGGVAN